MSLFHRRAEGRSMSYHDVWGSGDSTAAIGADAIQRGLRLGPVYAATSLIADLVSTAPLNCYQVDAFGIRTPLPTQPSIVTSPSPYGTRIDWIHQAMSSMLLRGNAYGYITTLDSAGRPAKIIWLNPDDVDVIEEQQDWFHTPTYFWRGRLLDPSLVVHIPAYTVAGSVIGMSPLTLFRKQIQLGLDAQDFGADWFKNGATPSGTLKNSAKILNPAEAQAAKTRFKESVHDRDVFVTGSDWSYSALGVPANESQFLETIKANATQIAAIYRVSPEDIGGEIGNSLTYKTLEQDQAKLTIRTLSVWCSRLAQAITDLLPDPQYVRFDVGAISRGDRSSWITGTATALNAGIMTNSEARAEEDKPPLTPEEVVDWQENYRAFTADPLIVTQPNIGGNDNVKK